LGALPDAGALVLPLPVLLPVLLPVFPLFALSLVVLSDFGDAGLTLSLGDPSSAGFAELAADGDVPVFL
jgi:hypothetical protein